MIKAIIFDLDDTLVPEVEYIKSGYKCIEKILKDRYPKLINVDVYKELLELFLANPKNVFNRFLDSYQISYINDDILYLVKEYRNHLPNIKLNDDDSEILTKLRAKGYKLGVITDGYKISQKKKVTAIELTNYVDYIVITDELGTKFWKPHPKPFELMREALNVNFNQMVYVGDNPSKDFYISSIFPIKTIRIIRSQGVYQSDSYLNNIKENVLIFSFKELEEAITEIEKMNNNDE